MYAVESSEKWGADRAVEVEVDEEEEVEEDDEGYTLRMPKTRPSSATLTTKPRTTHPCVKLRKACCRRRCWSITKRGGKEADVKDEAEDDDDDDDDVEEDVVDDDDDDGVDEGTDDDAVLLVNAGDG